MDKDATQLLSILSALAHSNASDEAVGQALRRLLAQAPADAVEQERPLERLKVRLTDGTRTTMTVPGSLLQAASRKYGSRKAARDRIVRLAASAPANVNNRSGWVQDALIRELAAAG